MSCFIEEIYVCLHDGEGVASECDHAVHDVGLDEVSADGEDDLGAFRVFRGDEP